MSLALPVNTHLVLVLLKLAMPARLWYVGNLFGMAKATIGEVILEVCRTLQDVLVDTVLHVHNPQAMMAGFCAVGFPQCTGIWDGPHILITCPPNGDLPYYSLRGFHSIIL